MLAFISAFFSWLAGRFQSRAELELEVFALRHQMAILRRQRPGRSLLCSIDRLLWVRLYRVWPRCLDVIVLVKSATVVQWHRQGFRLYWRWRSRPGRRAVDHDIRRLIREMSYANPLWGAPRTMASCSTSVSRSVRRRLQVHAAPATHAIADLAQLPQQRSTRHRRYRDLHRAVCDFPTQVRDAYPSSRTPEDGPLRSHAASDRGLVV